MQMAEIVKPHTLSARGCSSETGRLRKVLMCPPTYFEIGDPINVVQWLYSSDGLPKPEPRIMERQHQNFVSLLRENGVEVQVLDPSASLPFQHATRDVGTVIGDTIVLSNLKVPRRRGEAGVTRPYLEASGLRVITPDQGYVEGGDVVVQDGRLWVGIGGRTDERGVDFLYRTFKRDFEVIPLRFGARYTHLDTVLGVLGRDCALIFEPAFEAESLALIQETYPNLIWLSDKEQTNGGANVLPLNPNTLIAIAENGSVNQRLADLGFEVITFPYSEVIKTGGSVRCDTLPIERD
jgi:N-dimethylarginine dimethylaminohydrolase